MERRQFISRMLQSGSGLFLASSLPFEHTAGNTSSRNKLGIALVGLGSYATNELAPALQETKYCYLAAIVTGTPSKAEKWSKKYSIPDKNIYNYNNFDNIAGNKAIDIVYVVLPNSMHAEYTSRAAQAGKHVICEKPMAINVNECNEMITECKKAGKKLGIGYRLYYDHYNLKMMELGQHKIYGKLSTVSGGHAFHLKNPNAWRVDKKRAGGGPLMDLGIYCLQGCIYTTGELPSKVTAKNTTKDKDFFKDIEGSLEWEMQFPSGLRALCETSYEAQYNYLKAQAEKGIFELDPAYSYDGIKGKTPDGQLKLPHVNQQAKQMDDFAQSVLHNKPSIVPGEMGKRDVFIIEKIYESVATGKTTDLSKLPQVQYKI